MQGLPRRIGGRQRLVRALSLGVLVGLLVAGLTARGSFDGAEQASWAYRLRLRAQLSGAHAPIAPIVIVAIDDYTCGSNWHGCTPAVPRADTAVVIDKLRTSGVRLIALDQLFSTDRDGTDALATAIRRASIVVLAGQLQGPCSAEACARSLHWPIAPLDGAALDRGLANYSCDAPARQVEIYAPGCAFDGHWYPSLAVALYRMLRGRATAYQGATALRLNYAGPPGQTYLQTSYRTIVESHECAIQGRHVHCAGQVGPDLWDALRGAVALIGRTDAAAPDHYEDPLGGALPFPGVEVHATALNTLMNGDPIVPVTAGLATALVAALALLLAVVATFPPLLVGMVLSLCVLIGYYGLAFAALAAGNMQLPVVGPEIAMLTSFLLVLGARYALEEREARRTRQLLRRFVAPSVADDLVRDDWRSHAAGDQRPIAVLFSDLRGFTRLSENAEPAVIMGALRVYFGRMAPIVLQHGGTVDKYIGDGMMALFGAPQEIDAPCEAALRAAIAMHGAMAEINELLSGHLPGELRVGIGINYGNAVFGLAGAPSRLEFTAIGDTVNVAARLESLCGGTACGIVISDTVYERVAASLQEHVHDLGIVQVKGRTGGLHAYGIEVVGPELLRLAELG